MKQLIISSINHNLSSAITLLKSIDSHTYCNTSVEPYCSSIGDHIRHMLDFFDCIIDGLDSNNIDLTARKRDEVLSTEILRGDTVQSFSSLRDLEGCWS